MVIADSFNLDLHWKHVSHTDTDVMATMSLVPFHLSQHRRLHQQYLSQQHHFPPATPQSRKCRLLLCALSGLMDWHLTQPDSNMRRFSFCKYVNNKDYQHLVGWLNSWAEAFINLYFLEDFKGFKPTNVETSALHNHKLIFLQPRQNVAGTSQIHLHKSGS